MNRRSKLSKLKQVIKYNRLVILSKLFLRVVVIFFLFVTKKSSLPQIIILNSDINGTDDIFRLVPGQTVLKKIKLFNGLYKS
jgi:hypothetical protein